jgi:hypothetical protein
MSSKIEQQDLSYESSHLNGEYQENEEEWMAIKRFPNVSSKEVVNIVSLNLEFEKVYLISF